MEILKKHNHQRETGEKKSSIKLFTDDRPVDKLGNPLPYSVNLVAKCVTHYRKAMRPIKTIYLCPAYFNKFDYWARTHMTEKEGDLAIMLWTFDGCEIEMMQKDHVIRQMQGDDTFDWDFYPAKTND